MPKARKKAPVDDVELDPSPRDFVMARIAAARAQAQTALEALDALLNLFVNPDQDPKGRERKSLVDEALHDLGGASRALESAEEGYSQVDPSECEPWDEDGEPGEDDEDDEDEDD